MESREDVMELITTLAKEIGIKESQAAAAVQLIDEGNTIPFIARYMRGCSI